MLILSSLIITVVSIAAFFFLIWRSYIKNVAECVCVGLMVVGLCSASLAICLYYAEYCNKYYLLNLYFFLSGDFLEFFQKFNVDVLGIGNLLTVSRLLFLLGVYGFCSYVVRKKFSLRSDWIVPVCILPIVANLSEIYTQLIVLFKAMPVPLYRAIGWFDWISKFCMLPPLAVTVFRLYRYYKSTHNPSLQKSERLFLVGIVLVCAEFLLILDLTPSSAASVYSSPYMMDIMTTLLYKTLIWPGIFLLYVVGILLITSSFSIVIFSSISIIRWQNYKRVVSLNINKSIPVTNAQNLIPFLHSFKNQLVSLRQFEQILTPENFAETYPLLCSVTDEMCRTIDNLYGNSRDIKLNLQYGDVEECITHAIEAVRVSKDIPITFEAETGCGAMFDTEYLQHALENILYNAVDACEGRRDGRVNVMLSRKKHVICIRVKDNGTGISRENLKKIMEPFFSTKTHSHSWGMGLSHVNKIINAHNGHVRFDSEIGVGTEVTIWLPTGY